MSVAKLIVSAIQDNEDNEDNIVPLKGLRPDNKEDIEAILEALGQIIEEGGPLNDSYHRGMTALHYVASLAHPGNAEEIARIATKLVELGADKDAIDADGNTPFALCHFSVMAALRPILQPSADTDMTEVLFNAANMKLSHHGESEIPGCLAVLQAIPDIERYESKTKWKTHPLHVAAYAGNLTAIEYLLNKGFDVNLVNKAGRMPIHEAAEKGHPRTIQMLLDHDASVNVLTRDKESPLHLAAGSLSNFREGVAATLTTLIHCGADLSQPNDLDQTPLQVAIAHGEIAFVQAFVDAGCDLEVTDNDEGDTPLLQALINKQEAIAALLIESGVDVNQGNAKHGDTPLMWALPMPSMVERLLDSGADVQSGDDEGNTAAHWIAEFAEQGVSEDTLIESLRVLIKAGVKLDKRNKEGKTLAELAAGSEKCARIAQHLNLHEE